MMKRLKDSELEKIVGGAIIHLQVDDAEYIIFQTKADLLVYLLRNLNSELNIFSYLLNNGRNHRVNLDLGNGMNVSCYAYIQLANDN